MPRRTRTFDLRIRSPWISPLSLILHPVCIRFFWISARFSAILRHGFRSAVKVRRIIHPRYKWIATYSSGDAVKKKYFTRKQDAEDFVDDREKEAIEHGAIELTASERAAVLEFRDRLGECRGTV